MNKELFKSFILLSRPKTLLLAVSPVFVSYALVHLENPFLFMCAAFSALFIQASCNAVNDYLDFESGVDADGRSNRLVASGRLSGRQARQGAILFFSLSVFFGLGVVYVGGLSALILGLVSLCLAYFYSGSFFGKPLSHTPVSDIFVFLFFGLIPVVFLVFLVRPHLWAQAILAGSQIGLLSCAVFAINNFRDRKRDESCGKKTLSVILGKWSVSHIAALYLVAFALCFVWLIWGELFACILPLVAWFSVRPILSLLYEMKNKSDEGLESLDGALPQAIGVTALFAFQLSLGLVLL